MARDKAVTISPIYYIVGVVFVMLGILALLNGSMGGLLFIALPIITIAVESTRVRRNLAARQQVAQTQASFSLIALTMACNNI